MANFLVTSPNLLTEGTNSDDLIVLQSAATLGATVFGNDGNDTISAIDGGSAFQSRLNGNAGSDSIVLSGIPFTLGHVGGGQDNDQIALTDIGASTFATIQGGKGADTIIISGAAAATNNIIGGNEGHDSIALHGFVSTAKSRVSLGRGKDSLTLSGAILAGSLFGGAGDDRIVGTAGILFKAGFRIEGDSLTNPEEVGNDTITLSGTFNGAGNLVQGALGADVISLAGSFNGSTVNGNEGHDSITLGADLGTGIFLGGGQGNDTLSVGGVFSAGFGTVHGGDGNDVINVSGGPGGDGTVIGGAGADAINFGTVTGSNIQSRYSAFSESNLSGYDTISAVGTGGTFVIGQTVVTANVGATEIGVGTQSAFIVNSVGVATTFGTAIGGGLTARAEVVDQFTVQGQAVVFSDNAGNSYVFIQGGNAGSGTDGDFLAQVKGGSISALAVTNGSAVTVKFAG